MLGGIRAFLIPDQPLARVGINVRHRLELIEGRIKVVT